ncbi:exonuclease domain-containing protein [Patulibacter sp.]|uniref:exonuclease domain-containing protein n=1 Tax=Patulibacter sp. TaxID=1912859 RepID=UPI00272490BE|nr:exonuclease domain-containing protein [Patulibacter sp.]MDO9409453.1 exonuclease domain-containing protein [Patulibacter sp.]
MSWHTRRLAAFDLETTGIDVEQDRVVTAAVSVVGGGLPTASRAWLVDPGVEIPAGASAVHGISTEQARQDGQDPAEAVEQITAALAEQQLAGVPIVAFNARFDLTILDREARRHGVVPLIDRIGGPDRLLVVDPFVIDKQVDRYRRGRRTLTAVCEHHRVPLLDAHDANADALAAARVAWRMATTLIDIGGAELTELHRQQVTWAAEQAASLEEYFAAQGRPERVEGQWPCVLVAALAVA